MFAAQKLGECSFLPKTVTELPEVDPIGWTANGNVIVELDGPLGGPGVEKSRKHDRLSVKILTDRKVCVSEWEFFA